MTTIGMILIFFLSVWFVICSENTARPFVTCSHPAL